MKRNPLLTLEQEIGVMVKQLRENPSVSASSRPSGGARGRKETRPMAKSDLLTKEDLNHIRRIAAGSRREDLLQIVAQLLLHIDESQRSPSPSHDEQERKAREFVARWDNALCEAISRVGAGQDVATSIFKIRNDMVVDLRELLHAEQMRGGENFKNRVIEAIGRLP